MVRSPSGWMMMGRAPSSTVGGVNAVGKPFLDDDGVTEVALGLREQVANGDGLPCAGHAEQHGVLRRFVVSRAGERFDADEIVLRAIVNRLRACQVTGEGAGDGQHVGEEAVLRVELAVFVTPPRPARPGLEEQIPRRAGQIALEILRRVHRVDGVLDCARSWR